MCWLLWQRWVTSSRANALRRRWRDLTSRHPSRWRSCGSETVSVWTAGAAAGAVAGAAAGVADHHFLSVSGSGEKLGDIPRTGYQITKMKPADLKPLHVILFDRPGKVRTRHTDAQGDIDNQRQTKQFNVELQKLVDVNDINSST